MKGNYLRPSELLNLQRKTGKSYWDLIGRPLYDEGKDVDTLPLQAVEDPNIKAALEYAISLKLDRYAQESFNNGKDVAGSYNFNAIPKISPNAGVSYGSYYDNITGDVIMDSRQQSLPEFKKGKSSYTGAPDLISHYEGFRDTVYLNKGDGPAVGFGTTAPKLIDYAKKKGRITREEGMRALMEHLNDSVIPVLERRIPGYKDMPKQALDVLLDIVYNIGEGGLFNNSPKFMKALRAKDYKEAANQMDWDNNKPGFSKGARARNAERLRLWNEAWANHKPTTTIQRLVNDAPQYRPAPVKMPLTYNMTPQQAQYDPSIPESINVSSGTATWPRTTVLPDIIDSYNALWSDSPVLKPINATK